ncbi:hypothetical protein CR513_29712, partial [Mucuna pruriens]
MNKLIALVLLLLAQILVLQAMANEPETQAPLSGINPFEHKAQAGVQLHDQVAVSGATDESKAAEAPHIRRLGRHHSTDKSVAGGGVIIGGLVTAIFAAVFCYIRCCSYGNLLVEKCYPIGFHALDKECRG